MIFRELKGSSAYSLHCQERAELALYRRVDPSTGGANQGDIFGDYFLLRRSEALNLQIFGDL